MIRKLFILIIFLFFSWSCGEIINRISATADFDTIIKGNSHCHSLFGAPDLTVSIFDNEADFSNFWSEHSDCHFPFLDTPEVDFQTEMIIVALDNQETSGGYSVNINSLKEADGRIIINITKISPGKRCITPCVITRPYHIIKTAKSDRDFTVSLTRKITVCD